jgi:hypothetical protein
LCAALPVLVASGCSIGHASGDARPIAQQPKGLSTTASSTTLEGGTWRERRRLRTVLSAMGKTHVVKIRLRSRRYRNGSRRWIELVSSASDRSSSIHGKWSALFIGSAVAMTREAIGPPVAGMIVVTRHLALAEDGRLAVRFGSYRSRRLPLSPRDLVTQTAALGVRVDAVSIIGGTGSTPRPVEISGTLGAFGDYLNVLSSLARLSRGQNAYFEVRSPGGSVVMRLGHIQGVTTRGGYVGWVSPRLLRRP